MTVAQMDQWLTPQASDSALQRWQRDAAAAAVIVADLATTPFIPLSLRQFRGEGDDRTYDPQATTAVVVAALLTGQELGLAPMASLRSIDVVNGTPALRALALRALVLQRGHDIWLVEATDTRAIMEGRRAGSEQTQRVVWDIERARKLNLVGKQNWRVQPRNMLIARATAELARLIAPEAILGMPYVAEELADEGTPADGLALPVDSPETEPPRRRASRARKPAPVVEASLPDPVANESEPPLDEAPATHSSVVRDKLAEPHEPMVNPQQRAAIHAMLARMKVTNRDDKLAMVSGMVQDDIHSTLDLTQRQASSVLDQLNQMLAQHQAAEEAGGKDDWSQWPDEPQESDR